MANPPADGDSVSSSARFTDVSQVNPERDKISNFGENKYIESSNVKLVFKFWELPSNLIVRNNIDEGDMFYQQCPPRFIAKSSVPTARKMHGPSRSMLLAGARAQRIEACFNFSATMSGLALFVGPESKTS